MNDSPEHSASEHATSPGRAGQGSAALVPLRRALLLFSLLLAPLLAIPPLEAQEADSVQAVAGININRADAETLAAGLDGIGLARAQEIIRYREAYGPFTSIEELVEVKGIGPATLDRNRAVITLE
jgi:competence protein ComEA